MVNSKIDQPRLKAVFLSERLKPDQLKIPIVYDTEATERQKKFGNVDKFIENERQPNSFYLFNYERSILMIGYLEISQSLYVRYSKEISLSAIDDKIQDVLIVQHYLLVLTSMRHVYIFSLNGTLETVDGADYDRLVLLRDLILPCNVKFVNKKNPKFLELSYLETTKNKSRVYYGYTSYKVAALHVEIYNFPNKDRNCESLLENSKGDIFKKNLVKYDNIVLVRPEKPAKETFQVAILKPNYFENIKIGQSFKMQDSKHIQNLCILWEQKHVTDYWNGMVVEFQEPVLYFYTLQPGHSEIHKNKLYKELKNDSSKKIDPMEKKLSLGNITKDLMTKYSDEIPKSVKKSQPKVVNTPKKADDGVNSKNRILQK